VQSEVKIEYVPLSQLERWPRNPKQHDLAQIDKSIERFGFIQPIAVDERTGRIVAGHGRLEALQAMQLAGKAPPARVLEKDGEWLVPVLRGVEFKDDREAEAFLVADNRLVEIGGWDEQALAKILADLQPVGLDGVGWSDSEINRLVTETVVGEVQGVAPSEALSMYNNTTIRQLVMYFSVEEFQTIMTRIKSVMDKEKLETVTAVFQRLLDEHEKAGS
jgi:ParB-like chromosome segregation protein Spo0J